MNSYKIGQCYPDTYQNDSFHRLVFEEMDGALAARPSAVAGFREVVRVVTSGDSEDAQAVFLRLWSVGETGCKE